MSSLRAVLLIISLAFALNSHAGSSPDMKAFAVETINMWNQALNNKDAARFSGLFTVNAVLLTPGGDAVAGIHEIYSYVDDLVQNDGLGRHKIEVISVGVNDGRILIKGKWESANDINGVHRGDLFTILEKQYDGNWRTSFVKWN